MPTTTRAGDLLAGRYRLADLLAESGSGLFWRAHDEVLSRHVAIHLIPSDDERAGLLLDAARRSATVLDRRILRVLDAEVRGRLCYVVNEWGQGISLDDLLATEGPLEPRRAAWIVSEVGYAIAGAHDAGHAHGRLVPENVLLDPTGSVRVIGFAVDAALHGLPPGRRSTDVVDLASLLYAALTGRWPGISRSEVPEAPLESGHLLRARQVRAGIPRALDELCDRVINPYPAANGHGDPAHDLSTARGITDALREFVGDPTDLVLAESAREPARLIGPPPAPEGWQDSRPAPREDTVGEREGAPDTPPRGTPAQDTRAQGTPETAESAAPDTAVPASAAQGAGVPASAAQAAGVPAPAAQAAAAAASPPVDQATQAGMPIFHEGDEVSWLPASADKPPPPPPFEDPPDRPLFAPDPPDGRPVRRPRPGPANTGTGSGFWPWETGTGATPTTEPQDDEDVPGRRWLRLAAALALLCLLLLGVVVAYNLGRGRTPLGGEPEEPGPRATPAGAQRIDGVTASDFDPQGSPPEEYPELAPLITDGRPDTSWRTSTYEQNLGPAGLKTGVGVLLDLRRSYPVRGLTLTFVGAPTAVSVYVTDERPAGVRGLEPVGTWTAGTQSLRATLERPADGRYVVVWLTSLPMVESGFRAEIAEVVVRR